MTQSAGLRFRQALANSKPLQIVGTTNAYFALMAEQTIDNNLACSVY